MKVYSFPDSPKQTQYIKLMKKFLVSLIIHIYLLSQNTIFKGRLDPHISVSQFIQYSGFQQKNLLFSCMGTGLTEVSQSVQGCSGVLHGNTPHCFSKHSLAARPHNIQHEETHQCGMSKSQGSAVLDVRAVCQ